MAHANPIQIQKYLKGVDYPATRDQLIENAKNLGADDSVCASLGQLPDEEFQTPTEVSQAFKGPSSDNAQEMARQGGQQGSQRGEQQGEQEGEQEREPKQAQRPARASRNQQEPGAREFLIQVMEDSLAEMELCMVALDNSESHEIKAFAQSMIDEHGKLGQKIEQMARTMKVPFPKKVRAEHAGMIREMSKLMGDDFDRRFVEQNLQYHENDLKVFQHYASEEAEGPVGELADAGVKLFTRHLKMVKELAHKQKN